MIRITVRHFKWQVSVLAFNNRIDPDLNTDEIVTDDDNGMTHEYLIGNPSKQHPGIAKSRHLDDRDYLHSAEGSVGSQSESLMDYSEYGTSGDIIQGFHEYKQLDRSGDNTLYEEYSTLKENYALDFSEGKGVNPVQNIDEIEDIGIL